MSSFMHNRKITDSRFLFAALSFSNDDHLILRDKCVSMNRKKKEKSSNKIDLLLLETGHRMQRSARRNNKIDGQTTNVPF